MMKTTLITGANGGIGLAITERMLKEGYRVIAHYRNSDAALKRIACANLLPVQGDFSTAKGVKDFCRKVQTMGLPIDILVNNAGFTGELKPLLELSEENLEAVLQVNFKAPFFLAQAFLPSMISKHWGRIINISSIGVKFGGSPVTAHYSISKAALEALTHSLHKLGASQNVLVNTIRVGVVQTPMQQGMPLKKIGDRVSLIPLGRGGTPDEIASAVAFLASDQSSYVAGSTLVVAGGE